MREEPTWFARWEEDLPSPEELMPLTQTLITPDLALAFDIPSPESAAAAAGAEFLRQGITHNQHHHLLNHHVQQKDSAFPPSSQPSPAQSQGHHQSQLQQHHLGQAAAAAAADYDSSELGGSASGGNGGAGSGGDEQARTLKRPRLVWTPQLHKRFVDAVAHLGIKNAVPKTIMQLMSVEGLTRENVASHLQKYRLYLKRMQGLSGGPGGGGGVGQISHADSATEQLFASGPVPHPLLHHRGPTATPVGAGGSDQYFPFASMGSLHPHQPPSHQQQMAAAAAAAAAAANYQQQQQFYQQHRQQQQQILGSPPGNGFDRGLFGGARQQTQHQHHPAAAAMALQRMMAPVGVGIGAAAGFGSSPFGEDLDSGVGTGGAPERRKELTLFPTNDG